MPRKSALRLRQASSVRLPFAVREALPPGRDERLVWTADMGDPDPYPPEAWVRAGLAAATPAVVDRIVGLLGFREEPASSTEHLSVFRIVASGPEVVHLEASAPLMHVVVVGRNVEPTRRLFTSVLTYQRPVLARAVWAVIGVGHRRLVPPVLTSLVAAS